jgi:hypothetical protein
MLTASKSKRLNDALAGKNSTDDKKIFSIIIQPHLKEERNATRSHFVDDRVRFVKQRVYSGSHDKRVSHEKGHDVY